MQSNSAVQCKNGRRSSAKFLSKYSLHALRLQMAGSALYQQSCRIHGVLVEGCGWAGYPDFHMVHRCSPWWLRHHARQEGLLVSYGDHPLPDKRVSPLHPPPLPWIYICCFHLFFCSNIEQLFLGGRCLTGSVSLV